MANSDTGSDSCRTTCLLPSCGDGVIDSGEECDDALLNQYGLQSGVWVCVIVWVWVIVCMCDCDCVCGVCVCAVFGSTEAVEIPPFTPAFPSSKPPTTNTAPRANVHPVTRWAMHAGPIALRRSAATA